MGKTNKSPFVPERLREARISRGMTAKELAEKIGKTSQAISQYERGENLPSTEVLFNISNVLSFPLPYFSDPIKEVTDTTMGPTYFRSLTAATKMARDKHKIKVKHVERIFNFLDKYVDFPCVNVPDYSSDDLDDDRIEEIANEVRRFWGLGLGPIDNLTLLLEKQGIIVSLYNLNEEKLDACSQWRGNRPYIFLCDDNKSAARYNFDLAHELGHLVLHRWIDVADLNTLKKIEKQAYRFAGAFLMPENTFSREVITNSIDQFISLKRRWKVSIQAMVYRCEELEYLSEHQALYLRKKISMNKWRKNEPLDNELLFNKPSMFRQAFEMILENNVLIPSGIIESIKFHASDIEELAVLKPGTLNPRKDIEVMPLKIKSLGQN